VAVNPYMNIANTVVIKVKLMLSKIRQEEEEEEEEEEEW